MPNVSSVSRLPLEVVIEVKRRLRSGAHTQLEVAQWLKDNGHEISKSAINRFALKLYKEDAARGIDKELLAGDNTNLITLFEELADLKAREGEIIAQIQSASLRGKQTAS